MNKLILFIVLAIPVSSYAQISIVNGGNAVGCASSQDTTDVTITTQQNGSAFNTTGASVLVVAVSSYQAQPTTTVTDNKGNGYAAVTGMINAPLGALTHQVFYSIVSTGVGANHTWTINDGSALMSICVIAISGTGAYQPLVTSSTNTGSATSVSVGPQNINHTNSFIISTAGFYGTSEVSGPTGFSTPVFVNWVASPQAMGTGIAWKNDTTYGTETPVWTFNGANDNAATSIVFRATNSVNRIGHGPCNVTVASLSFGTVNTAVQNAQNGDVLCLPGNGTQVEWDNQLNINNAIELRGNGSLPTIGSPRQTKIYIGSTIGGFGLIVGNESTAYPIMLDGLDFVLDQNTGTFADQGMLVFNINNGVGWPIIIHHNDYDLSNMCTGPVLNNIASSHGVIYRNRGTGTPPANLIGTGCTPGGQHLNTNIQFVQNFPTNPGVVPWGSNSTLGSLDNGYNLNNFYLDMNELHGFFATTDCSENCRMAIRGNTIDSGGIRSHGADSDPNGTRAMELINNTFQCIAGTQNGGFYAHRGGTHREFGNTFPNAPPLGTACNIDSGGYANNSWYLYRLYLCTTSTTSGWPGSYPNTYPLPRMIATGWNSMTNTVVGLGQTGSSFLQSPDPLYEAANTYGTGVANWDINTGPSHECRAMSVSTTSSTLSTTTVLSATGGYPAYVNSGQFVIVTFSDQIGGVAPTIANTCSDGGAGQAQTWTAGSGGSNGNLRLSMWTATFNRTCDAVITITHANSAANRVLTFTQIRGLAASPIDRNPATVNYTNTNSFNSPTITPSVSTGEIALQYIATTAPFVLGAGPMLNEGGLQCPNGSNCAPPLDNTNDHQANTCGPAICPGQPYATAENGTNTASNNVTSDIIYHNATTNSAITTNIQDVNGNVNAVTGIISLKVGTNTSGGPSACSQAFEVYGGGMNNPSCLDLLITDFLQSKRDYFSEVVGDGGASHGTRASRPACTVVGQGYWSTDQGNWNTSGIGGNGVLDICTVVGTPGTWTNAAYVPANLPNFWEDVVSSGASTQSFTSQPTNTNSGSTFSPVVTVTVSTGNNDSITLSVSAGTCTLTGTLTRTAVSGLATFTGLGVSGTPTSGCSIKSHDNTDNTIADVVSNLYNMTGVLTFSSQPTNTASGSAFSPTVTVTTSVSSTDSITITLLNCTGGSLTGTTTVSAVAGVATFSGMGMSGTPTTNCSLNAHDGTNSNYHDVVSNTFVTTGTLTFSSQPTTTTSGQNFSPTVTVTTSPSSTDSITISLNACSTGSGNLTGTLTVSASAGVATFTGVGVTGSATGCTLKAHDNTNSQLADVNSGSFNISSPGVLTFSQQPTTTASGSNFSPTVTVTITPSAADSITISVTSGTCSLTGTTTVTASGGVATFTSVGVSGTPQVGCVLKAHDNTTASVADVNSSAFNMTGSMAFTAQPTTTLTGSVFNPTVVVTVSPAAADSVSVAIGSCPNAHLVGTTTVTANGSGVATFTGLAVAATVASNNCFLMATDNTNSSVNGQNSTTFNVTLPAIPAHRARRILK